jgi:hypothetical protein
MTSDVQVAAVQAASYVIATAAPEADGTLAWAETAVVVAQAEGGGHSGLGWTYASPAAQTIITSMLAEVVAGRSVGRDRCQRRHGPGHPQHRPRRHRRHGNIRNRCRPTATTISGSSGCYSTAHWIPTAANSRRFRPGAAWVWISAPSMRSASAAAAHETFQFHGGKSQRSDRDSR